MAEPILTPEEKRYSRAAGHDKDIDDAVCKQCERTFDATTLQRVNEVKVLPGGSSCLGQSRGRYRFRVDGGEDWVGIRELKQRLLQPLAGPSAQPPSEAGRSADPARHRRPSADAASSGSKALPANQTAAQHAEQFFAAAPVQAQGACLAAKPRSRMRQPSAGAALQAAQPASMSGMPAPPRPASKAAAATAGAAALAELSASCLHAATAAAAATLGGGLPGHLAAAAQGQATTAAAAAAAAAAGALGEVLAGRPAPSDVQAAAQLASIQQGLINFKAVQRSPLEPGPQAAQDSSRAPGSSDSSRRQQGEPAAPQPGRWPRSFVRLLTGDADAAGAAPLATTPARPTLLELQAPAAAGAALQPLSLPLSGIEWGLQPAGWALPAAGGGNTSSSTSRQQLGALQGSLQSSLQPGEPPRASVVPGPATRSLPGGHGGSTPPMGRGHASLLISAAAGSGPLGAAGPESVWAGQGQGSTAGRGLQHGPLGVHLAEGAAATQPQASGSLKEQLLLQAWSKQQGLAAPGAGAASTGAGRAAAAAAGAQQPPVGRPGVMVGGRPLGPAGAAGAGLGSRGSSMSRLRQLQPGELGSPAALAGGFQSLTGAGGAAVAAATAAAACSPTSSHAGASAAGAAGRGPLLGAVCNTAAPARGSPVALIDPLAAQEAAADAALKRRVLRAWRRVCAAQKLWRAMRTLKCDVASRLAWVYTRSVWDWRHMLRMYRRGAAANTPWQRLTAKVLLRDWRQPKPERWLWPEGQGVEVEGKGEGEEKGVEQQQQHTGLVGAAGSGGLQAAAGAGPQRTAHLQPQPQAQAELHHAPWDPECAGPGCWGRRRRHWLLGSPPAPLRGPLGLLQGVQSAAAAGRSSTGGTAAAEAPLPQAAAGSPGLLPAQPETDADMMGLPAAAGSIGWAAAAAGGSASVVAQPQQQLPGPAQQSSTLRLRLASATEELLQCELNQIEWEARGRKLQQEARAATAAAKAAKAIEAAAAAATAHAEKMAADTAARVARHQQREQAKQAQQNVSQHRPWQQAPVQQQQQGGSRCKGQGCRAPLG